MRRTRYQRSVDFLLAAAVLAVLVGSICAKLVAITGESTARAATHHTGAIVAATTTAATSTAALAGNATLAAIDPRDYGAILNDPSANARQTNDRAMQAIIAALPDTGGAISWRGTLHVNQTVEFPKRNGRVLSFAILGDGASTRLQKHGDDRGAWAVRMESVFSMPECIWRLDGVTVTSSGNGVFVSGTNSGKAVKLARLTITGCQGAEAFRAEACDGPHWPAINTSANAGDGAVFRSCHQVQLPGFTSRVNKGRGLVFERDCAAVQMNAYVESNGGYGLDAYNIKHCDFSGSWFEANLGGRTQTKLRECLFNRFSGQLQQDSGQGFDVDAISAVANDLGRGMLPPQQWGQAVAQIGRIHPRSFPPSHITVEPASGWAGKLIIRKDGYTPFPGYQPGAAIEFLGDVPGSLYGWPREWQKDDWWVLVVDVEVDDATLDFFVNEPSLNPSHHTGFRSSLAPLFTDGISLKENWWITAKRSQIVAVGKSAAGSPAGGGNPRSWCYLHLGRTTGPDRELSMKIKGELRRVR